MQESHQQELMDSNAHFNVDRYANIGICRSRHKKCSAWSIHASIHAQCCICEWKQKMKHVHEKKSDNEETERVLVRVTM